MRKFTQKLTGLLVLVFFSFYISATAQMTPGDNQVIINQLINEILTPRNVYIKTPSSFNTNNMYPIVFIFHGGGGSGEHFLQNNFLNDLIDQEEFVAIYPNGHSDNQNELGGYWNLGNEFTSADDVEFTDMIFEELAQYNFIDFSKAYAIGLSNGAGMVNLLGKSTSHFIGIAPLFSQQLLSIGNLNNSFKKLRVFQVCGENDNVIPIVGGNTPNGEFLSGFASAENWANQLECDLLLSNQEIITIGNTTFNTNQYNYCSDPFSKVNSLLAINTGHNFNNPLTEQSIFQEIWHFFNDVSQLNINETNQNEPKLIKMIDILGREEVEHKKGSFLFYIYDNGKIVKKFNP